MGESSGVIASRIGAVFSFKGCLIQVVWDSGAESMIYEYLDTHGASYKVPTIAACQLTLADRMVLLHIDLFGDGIH